MKGKTGLVLVALLFIQTSVWAQSKLFFQSIELSLNGYVGDGFSTTKSQWQHLFKQQRAYNLDTFPAADIPLRNGMATLFPNPVSIGLATSKQLPLNSHTFQLFWQMGVQVQPYITYQYNYYSSDTSRGLVAASFTDVGLEHRSQWMNVSNDMQCSFKGLLLPRQLTYTIGAGLGLLLYTKSDIEETVIRYRKVPIGTGYTITEDSRTQQVIAAKKPVLVNWSISASATGKLFKQTDVTAGMRYQNFQRPIGWKSRWFAEDGYLYVGLKYNF